MHHFYQRNGALYVEGVAVRDLVKRHGTPLYVYSAQTIVDHFNRLESALAPLDHRICFATKANSTLAILGILAARGSGFDVTTAGELYRVRKAGGQTSRCTFVGVGKSRAEIEAGLRSGVYSFIAESEHELRVINEVAKKLKKQAPVAVRVNPNVDAQTHAKITTGTYANKFGIVYEEIPGLYARAAKLKNLWLRGVQMHIGSQITDVKPFVQAVQKMLPLVQRLKTKHHIEFFDVGGGMGIIYPDALASGQPGWWKKRPHILRPDLYAERIVPLLQPLGLKILVEPGRYMVGNAGILVTEVLYIKQTGQKNFVIVDAAMNDLLRPTLYESYHEIVPVLAKRKGRLILSDVVGPVCESGDYLAKDRPLPPVQPGETLAVMSTGAYGMAMASNYNARPRAAEILVEGKKARVVRRRETLADLVRGESV